MPESPAPAQLFYSYSHKDERFREQLETHLSILRRQRLISEWHDRKIDAGTEWKDAIDDHLKAASIILLLVTADFLASDYCYDVELRYAMERHQKGKARVIPVILQPCDWQTSSLAGLQALPKDGKPVTKWQNRNDAWLNVAQGIRAVLYAMKPVAASAPVELGATSNANYAESFDGVCKGEIDIISHPIAPEGPVLRQSIWSRWFRRIVVAVAGLIIASFLLFTFALRALPAYTKLDSASPSDLPPALSQEDQDNQDQAKNSETKGWTPVKLKLSWDTNQTFMARQFDYVIQGDHRMAGSVVWLDKGRKQVSRGRQGQSTSKYLICFTVPVNATGKAFALLRIELPNELEGQINEEDALRPEAASVERSPCK